VTWHISEHCSRHNLHRDRESCDRYPKETNDPGEDSFDYKQPRLSTAIANLHFFKKAAVSPSENAPHAFMPAPERSTTNLPAEVSFDPPTTITSTPVSLSSFLTTWTAVSELMSFDSQLEMGTWR
jgi:hypothetical protein